MLHHHIAQRVPTCHSRELDVMVYMMLRLDRITNLAPGYREAAESLTGQCTFTKEEILPLQSHSGITLAAAKSRALILLL